MKISQKFIDALQEDTEWMYKERMVIWTNKFSEKWGISAVTMRKYMPNRKRTYPTKDEIQALRDEWKTDLEIQEIFFITKNQLWSLSRKEPRHQLTDEQKREIKESNDTSENLARQYNTMKSIVDELRRFKKVGLEERVLNTWKWDRSIPKPYWEDIWEVHTMWPAKFIKFNTPLWIPEEKWL